VLFIETKSCEISFATKYFHWNLESIYLSSTITAVTARQQLKADH